MSEPEVCRHCGVEIRVINWALGPEWMHSTYPHRTRDAYRYCHFAVAEPASADSADADSGRGGDGASVAERPEAELEARARGEQVTACPVCGELIADPLLWLHEERHARDGGAR